MAARLKGNLGLKSSPLAPTACKLSTQYLVLDHMSNHYNKIAKAKSAIDSKPPKSLSTSQKLRDRRNRDKIAKSPRTRPATAMSHNGYQTYQDVFDDDPEDDEERLVHSIMRSTLLDKGQSSTTLHEDMDTRTMIRPSSARSVQSGHSLRGSRQPMAVTSSHDSTRITYQGDVLEKRSYLFTEPQRPFTPRTLRNNHQSRLKNSKCYNPPPAKSLQSGDGRMSRSSQLAPEVRSTPKPQPRGKSRRQLEDEDAEEDLGRRRKDSFHGLGETMESTGQLSESMLMDITLRSRDPRQKGATRERQGVPPLAISMDQDHMNWLQEQASKAQVRARGGSRGSTLRAGGEEEDGLLDESERGAPVRESIRRETLQNIEKMHCYRLEGSIASRSGSLISCSSCTSWVTEQLKKEDEDQKYLAFAKEVTDDVLSRGICTDSVLHRVFENHIEKKKDQLDEERMRQVIRDLRRDLGLRDSSLERTPLASLSDKSRNNNTTNGGTMAPVTVITNGETSNGSQQQTSSGSKATTASTSAKDESSSNTFSPGNHYSRVLGEGRAKGGTTSTSLEPLNVMSSPSENGSATMESVSSFRFGQTGEMVDTITSHEAIQEDTAREREEEQADDDHASQGNSGSDELSATQALKQYEFDLTVKEGTAEVSTGETTTANGTNGTSGKDESDNGVQPFNSRRRRHGKYAASKLERPATGERREDEEDVARSELSANARNGSTGSQQRNGRDTLAPTQAASNDDDTVSIKSSASSQRPAVRPRTKLHQPSTESETKSEISPSQMKDDRGEDEEKSVSEAAEVKKGNTEEQRHTEGEKSQDDEYDDDYEEDDEDGGDTTHRTSDDDF